MTTKNSHKLKKSSEKFTSQIMLYLTSKQLKKLEKSASDNGMKRQEFMRLLIDEV